MTFILLIWLFILILLSEMLVDPRPYTYEYRTPRYSNPTYQSGNLYDSLYMKKNQSNDYFNHDGSTKGGIDNSNPERGHKMSRSRNMSMDLGALKKINETRPAGSTGRTDAQSGFKLPSISRSPERPVQEARGSSGSLPKSGFQRFRIYEHQQKPYDIIANAPRAHQSIRLRNWPKYSLEHRLRERGKFHNYEKEEF